MKLLFFLAGLLAFASAYPLQTADQELASFDVDELFADEQITLDEVKKQLKERFEEVLDKIKDAIESGKSLKGEFFEKAKEIREKLKDLNVDIGEKGKDLLERIREKGKEFFKELFDKLGVNKETREIHSEMMADEYGDIVRQLKDKFEEVSKKVKDAFEQGKALKEGLDQLQEIRSKLKEYNIDLGGKYQEFLDKIKDKVKDYWNKLKEKLTSKRSAGIDILGMLEHLKEEIKGTFSFDRMKNIVEKYLGKGSEFAKNLAEFLKERGQKGREELASLVDRWMEEERSVTAYFRDIGINLKDRFKRFGQWVRERYAEALKGRTGKQNVIAIAREFITDARKISRDVAEEALDFFRQYKDDLGLLFKEVERKIEDIVKKEA